MYSNIEAERVRLDLTQEELCTRLEITTKTYRSWISKKHAIPCSKLVEMSKLFKCSTDYLLGITSYRGTSQNNRKVGD